VPNRRPGRESAFDDLRVTEFGVADVAVAIGGESHAGEKAVR